MGDGQPTDLRLYLVRHGQSETNLHRAHLIGGRRSWAELTPLGKEQARAVGRVWAAASVHDHQIVASTAVRATQTARYALEEAGLPLEGLRTSPDLEELELRFDGRWHEVRRGDTSHL